jgi:hypothetical protein
VKLHVFLPATFRLFLSAAALSSAAPAFAGPTYFDFKTGFGDEIVINRGWLGTKHTLVKDRLGDKYESKKGLLGNKEFSAGVLGNSFTKKKGILGRKEYQAKTLLGDSVTYKKGWFVKRASVDASGISGLLEQGINNLKGTLLTPTQQNSGMGYDPNLQGLWQPGSKTAADPQGLDAVNQRFDASQPLDAWPGTPSGNGTSP